MVDLKSAGHPDPVDAKQAQISTPLLKCLTAEMTCLGFIKHGAMQKDTVQKTLWFVQMHSP